MIDKAFAYKNENDILLISSSGGAYMGIVSTLLKSGDISWSVYGAAFDENFHVKHERAIDIEGCKRFCGSKYVQSDIRDIFEGVVTDLNNDINVLFTGTPCQIAAIKAYINKKNIDTEKLWTVDVVCHGTPPEKFWEEWIRYLERKNNSKLKNFSFRYKPGGWKGYPVLAEFQNGQRYENSFRTSSYMTLFRRNLLMRESCFHCRYPGNFQSDITISDFWGVEIVMPEIPAKGGVSLLLAHTEKGMNIVKALSPEPKMVMSENFQKYNSNLVHTTPKPDKYDAFWNDYRKHGLEYVLEKYGGNNLKGKIKFELIKFLRDSGLFTLGKKILNRA